MTTPVVPCAVVSLNYKAGDCGKALENTFVLQWFSHCSCCKMDEVKSVCWGWWWGVVFLELGLLPSSMH